MANPPVTFPALFTPANAVAFTNFDGTAENVSATTPLPVTMASPATVSASLTAAGTLVAAETANFMGGAFQITSAGTTCTISYEQSNDNTNWVALPVISAAVANAAPATTSTVAGIYAYVSSAAFVRARVSTYTSGTVSAVLNQKQQAVPIAGLSLAGSTSAIGSVSISSSVNPGVGYTDSTAVLAASATFTGTGRAYTGAQYEFFSATAFADQAGTLFIDHSLDSGATYQPVASQVLTANTAANLVVRANGASGTATLYRVRYANGAALQTIFRLSSGYSAS